MDGDWAWYDIPVTDDGFDFNDRPVALTNEVWFLTAFTFHREMGFAIVDDVIEVNRAILNILCKFPWINQIFSLKMLV